MDATWFQRQLSGTHFIETPNQGQTGQQNQVSVCTDIGYAPGFASLLMPYL